MCWFLVVKLQRVTGHNGKYHNSKCIFSFAVMVGTLPKRQILIGFIQQTCHNGKFAVMVGKLPKAQMDNVE